MREKILPVLCLCFFVVANAHASSSEENMKFCQAKMPKAGSKEPPTPEQLSEFKNCMEKSGFKGPKLPPKPEESSKRSAPALDPQHEKAMKFCKAKLPKPVAGAQPKPEDMKSFIKCMQGQGVGSH